jgi:catechol 2,3-dioxygenase-like lactoylglutathione lyase family enzyme
MPRITVITLGADDLDRSERFYRDGLGLKTEGIIGTEYEQGAVAFFELEGGLKLALWPRKSLHRTPRFLPARRVPPNSHSGTLRFKNT